MGLVVLVLGFFFLPFCAFGLILIVVGLVIFTATHPQTPAYYYPLPAVPGPSVAPPPAYAPAAPAVPPACPVCGVALSWVPQYGRWYCARCQVYR